MKLATIFCLGSGPTWKSEIESLFDKLKNNSRAKKYSFRVYVIDRLYSKRHVKKLIRESGLVEDLLMRNPNIMSVTFIGGDMFKWLEQYPLNDVYYIYSARLFEHLRPDQVSYLQYLLYNKSNSNTTLEVIVPDFLRVLETLERIDMKNNSAEDFSRDFVQITTELLSDLSDPHQSVWTKELAKYYLEVEGLWRISKIKYTQLSNRDWYLDILAKPIINPGT